MTLTDLHKILPGTWELVSWSVRYQDQNRPAVFPYGEDATGLLIYSDDGYMSACIAQGNRPQLSAVSTRMATGVEKQDAFDSYFQYAGRWEIAGDCVLHRVTHALNPNFPGSTQRRQVSFDDGDLLLSATEPLPDGRARHHVLRWRRPT